MIGYHTSMSKVSASIIQVSIGVGRSAKLSLLSALGCQVFRTDVSPPAVARGRLDFVACSILRWAEADVEVGLGLWLVSSHHGVLGAELPEARS
jgi:hypothetical protein